MGGKSKRQEVDVSYISETDLHCDWVALHRKMTYGLYIFKSAHDSMTTQTFVSSCPIVPCCGVVPPSSSFWQSA